MTYNSSAIPVMPAFLCILAMSILGCDNKETAFLKQLTGQPASKDGIKVSRGPTFNWARKDCDPSLFLTFTEGKQLIITRNEDKYCAQFSIEKDPKSERRMHISVNVKDLSLIEKEGLWGTYPTQAFAAEIIPNTGELLLTVSTGQYGDSFIVRNIAGIYSPTWSPNSIGRILEILHNIDRQLADISRKDAYIKEYLPQWERDRKELVQQLRDKGITSLQDVEKKHPDMKFLADELIELVRSIEEAEKKLAVHAILIAKLESAKRRYKRLRDEIVAGIFESENQVSAILSELDKELNHPPNNETGADKVVMAIDRDQILKRELGHTEAEIAKRYSSTTSSQTDSQKGEKQ